MEKFKREITISPAFDKRSPDPKKNYGIHGCNLSFYLTGAKGVVQFVIYTHWNLKHVQKELDAKPPSDDLRFTHLLCRPMPSDLGYHSPIPLYEDQPMLTDNCPFLKGKCFYDGSALNAEPVYWKMVEKGSDAVWEELERYYESRFGK